MLVWISSLGSPKFVLVVLLGLFVTVRRLVDTEGWTLLWREFIYRLAHPVLYMSFRWYKQQVWQHLSTPIVLLPDPLKRFSSVSFICFVMYQSWTRLDNKEPNNDVLVPSLSDQNSLSFDPPPASINNVSSSIISALNRMIAAFSSYYLFSLFLSKNSFFQRYCAFMGNFAV